jgi:hypothetical protein
MKSTRRVILLGGGAAAAVAVVAPYGLGAEAAVTVEVAPLAPAAAAYPWEWWFSYDGYSYGEQFGSKEAALKYLEETGEGMIAECQQQDFDLTIDACEILEKLRDSNEDTVGEGDFLEYTLEQENDLGEMLTRTMEEWVRKYKIKTTAWTFGGVRNEIKAD